MSGDIDSLIERLAGMSPEEISAAVEDAQSIVGDRKWIPNAGPQTDAYFSEADELFYGGQAGGGKSDLLVGLALEEHQRSLILRRYQDDADSLAERMMNIIGSRDGWNGQKNRIARGPWQATFKGVKDEEDKQRFKGRAFDLYGFDEIGDFTESQYRFITGWNRSENPKQRCRVVCTGNPPTSAEGLWVVKYWGPWLDPNHPKYPTPDGELRWYTTIDGRDTEVDGPEPIPDEENPGRFIIPKSRTFIRSTLQDNPDLARTNYDSVLAAMPEIYRQAYREGRFDISLQDKDSQMIPTQWVRDAFDRWEKNPPHGIPMCTIAADIAQGGGDQTVMARRHDTWFAPLVEIPGTETPDGPSTAARILGLRRDACDIVVDAGGGYGGSTIDHLRDNGIKVFPFKGAAKSARSTKDRTLNFVNRRAEAYWKFREALDPSQPGGSKLALHPDQELLAELTTPTFEVMSSGIKMEPKKDVVKRLGRSPDKADATVMCWYKGPTTETHYHEWRADQSSGTVGRRKGPKINMGNHVRRRR